MKPGGISKIWARKTWFTVHKWIGLLLFLLLIPLSASGSLLVWHDWTDSLFNPQRYAVSQSEAVLPVEAYLGSARSVLGPDDRIASIALPEEAGKPVVVTASPAVAGGTASRPGPPARYQLWLDPATAELRDHGDASTGVLRTLHVFHGSLMIAEWGRPIVGWLGVLMLLSCLSGIWLWWPRIGSLFRGLRWRRGPLISGNLHHQVGIWIALPLAALSFTGAYISFPDFFRSIEAGLGAADPQRRPPPNRRARPVEVAGLAPSAAIEAVRQQEAAAAILAMRWPTEAESSWTVTLKGEHRREVSVDDRTGEVKSVPPRTGIARFMRELHDGHSYNAVWQTVIFLAGLAPAILGITGVIMWIRTRNWRRRSVRKGGSQRPAAANPVS
jgi:uncharacterized iron-regulated membrane protein